MESSDEFPKFGRATDTWVWEEAINKLEVGLTDFERSPVDPSKVVVLVISSSSDSSGDQFGVIRGRDSAERAFNSIIRETKKARLADLELAVLPKGITAGKVLEEEVTMEGFLGAVSTVLKEAVDTGVWTISTLDPDCTIFALEGTPMHRSLKGVIAVGVTEETFSGAVFKAFIPQGSRVLGSGAFGTAILVTDRTDPRPMTWEQVVLKIEVKAIIYPADEDAATNPDLLGEATVGRLLNRVFYESRITPCTTRTYSMFQCQTLPPITGDWGELAHQILDQSHGGVGKVTTYQEYLYTEQEWVNRGTLSDFISGTLTDEAMKAIKEGIVHRKGVARSLLFQGLHALEAFRRAGFIHGDINQNNMGFSRVEGSETEIYFINGRGGKDDEIQAFKPLNPGVSTNDLRLKFLDYGFSKFYDAVSGQTTSWSKHEGRIPGKEITRTFTAKPSMPPEAFARLMGADQPTTGKRLLDTWRISTASDLWQFGLNMAAFIIGKPPLTNQRGTAYKHKPPKEFYDEIEKIIRSDLGYRHLVAYGKEKDVAIHFWNVASFIGFPWYSAWSWTPGKKAPPSKYIIRNQLKMKEEMLAKIPIYRAFEMAENAGLTYDWMATGGILGMNKIARGILGKDGLVALYNMLSWDPSDRLTPGKLITDLASNVFLDFAKDAEGVLIPDPLNVSVGQYHAFLARESTTWSVVTTDINYHVDISESIGHIQSTTGPSKFTKLPRPIYEELIQAGYTRGRTPNARALGPASSCSDFSGKEDWSAWL